MVHLLYYKGEADGGDVFYVQRKSGETNFSKPLQGKQTKPGSVTAMGTIRGAQLAVGKNARVHVVWDGMAKVHHAFDKWQGSSAAAYTRLNDTGTASSRNAMSSLMLRIGRREFSGR